VRSIAAELVERAPEDVLHPGVRLGVARQETLPDGVVAWPREGDPKLGAFPHEEAMRELHQDAGAITTVRLRSPSTPMVEVDEDVDTLLDDIV